jgi:uncharacterized RDD family membrane protein YckC
MTLAMSIRCPNDGSEMPPDVSSDGQGACDGGDFLLEDSPVGDGEKTSLLTGWRPGGLWARFAALMLDIFLVCLLLAGMKYLLELCAIALGGEEDAAAYWGEWMGYAVLWAYFGFFTGCCGQTPGKMMLHLKVIRMDGLEMGYFRAFLREIMKLFSALPLFLGYLPAVLRADKRGLHDFIAHSRVIHV